MTWPEIVARRGGKHLVARTLRSRTFPVHKRRRGDVRRDARSLPNYYGALPHLHTPRRGPSWRQIDFLPFIRQVNRTWGPCRASRATELLRAGFFVTSLHLRKLE
ncbi:hypothetical protein EVAR_14827_1 [Eumeta japonica]|uniref:Uncharacterized protein n=1 Tax=Eumeta variegata TaxID=151549 RepID=A0A4C1V456_EUMVA|nr:hypothetical protein EVAR_14827_1 [Eumeta japonica]